MTRNRIIALIVFIGAIVVCIAAFFVVTVVQPKNNIQVLAAPQSAVTVKVDDKTITSPQSGFYISPGSHKLSVTANNFQGVNENITTTTDLKTFTYCLEPTNMTEKAYYSNHPDDQAICDGVLGQEYNHDVDAAIQKYPIIQYLPYDDGTFSVGQGLSPTNTDNVGIYIHYSSDQSKNEALDWIKRYQDPSQLTIYYTGDYVQTDRIGGVGSQLDSILTKKYPIVSSLPIDASFYKLGYRIDESDKSGHSIMLTISSDSSLGRQAALNEIVSLGYNPVNFKIQFLNFESDLK